MSGSSVKKMLYEDVDFLVLGKYDLMILYCEKSASFYNVCVC